MAISVILIMLLIRIWGTSKQEKTYNEFIFRLEKKDQI